MSEQEPSPLEAATQWEDVVLPHDPPPPPGWVDPLEGTKVADVLDLGRSGRDGDPADS